MEKAVSPQLSSLAVDDMEMVFTRDMDVRPELYVVEPRNFKNYVLSPQSSADEVVVIGGRFTVSF